MTKQDQDLLSKSTLSYEEMQYLASHTDPAIRCKLAQRQDLQPEILYFLAEDNHPDVRQQIALNPTTPRQADLLLAKDDVESVRLQLTEKIGKLAPETTTAERTKIQALTYEALVTLSRDQTVKVRQILSETLKDMIDAPSEIIVRLAKDVELVVAGPVLEFSPVLTDEDLLEIISTTSTQGAINAISKRQYVSDIVSDAVIARNEESAITDLLANTNAQIREDAIDMLVGQAGSIVPWHAPLAKRPQLSAKAARRMAHFLADNLLDHLRKREDLPDDVMAELADELKKRIDRESEAGDNEAETDPIEGLKAKHEAGELDEEYLAGLLDENQWLEVTSALAVLSGLRRVTVKKIISSQSGKGILALAWKSGLSAKMGENLQIKLAKMPISSLVRALADGSYPLTDDELEWHLELFGDD